MKYLHRPKTFYELETSESKKERLKLNDIWCDPTYIKIDNAIFTSTNKRILFKDLFLYDVVTHVLYGGYF